MDGSPSVEPAHSKMTCLPTAKQDYSKGSASRVKASILGNFKFGILVKGGCKNIACRLKGKRKSWATPPEATFSLRVRLSKYSESIICLRDGFTSTYVIIGPEKMEVCSDSSKSTGMAEGAICEN